MKKILFVLLGVIIASLALADSSRPQSGEYVCKLVASSSGGSIRTCPLFGATFDDIGDKVVSSLDECVSEARLLIGTTHDGCKIDEARFDVEVDGVRIKGTVTVKRQ